jgi:hypothetical protein
MIYYNNQILKLIKYQLYTPRRENRLIIRWITKRKERLNRRRSKSIIILIIVR